MGVNKTFREVMQNAGQVKHDKQLRNLGRRSPTSCAMPRARRANTIYMSPISQDGRHDGRHAQRVAQPFALSAPAAGRQQQPGRLHAPARGADGRQVQSEVARRVVGRRWPARRLAAKCLSRLSKACAGCWIALARRLCRAGKFWMSGCPGTKRKDVAQTYIKSCRAPWWRWTPWRASAGLPRRPVNEANYRFLIDSLVGSAPCLTYGAPVFMQLDGLTKSRPPACKSPVRQVRLSSILARCCWCWVSSACFTSANCACGCWSSLIRSAWRWRPTADQRPGSGFRAPQQCAATTGKR